MMTADEIMVDTNILVYSTAGESKFRDVSRKTIKKYVDDEYTLWITRQILREYLVVKSRLMIDENKYDENQLSFELNYFTNNYKVADEIDNTTFILTDLIAKLKNACPH